MSITDELREWARGLFNTRETVLAIADRIDAEHEREVADTRNDALFRANEKDMGELGFVRLPKDADGKVIRIGDKVTCGAIVWEVTGFRLAGGGWGICCTIFNDQGGSGTNVYPPSELHHYHAPTVENVLREMLYKAHIYDEREMELLPDLIAEYAAKLRLAESEES